MKLIKIKRNKFMNIIIKNARLFDSGKLVHIKVLDGIIAKISENYIFNKNYEELDACGNFISPGFIDIHVHLRDPGLTYKEDINTGTLAAVKGGVTTVCAMPNTKPAADNPETIKYILDTPANCRVLPVAAITKTQEGKELTDFQALKKAGAIALSDDGRPVENADLMREALIKSRENNILIISHCEDLELARDGIMNNGEILRRINREYNLDLHGIPNEAEDKITRRDIALAHETSARLHIAHVSTKNSCVYIADAKNRGVKITAETCPHYFSLTDEAVLKSGVNAKMNPPLRTLEDCAGIIDALKSGVIDCISTDHAPHSLEDKLGDGDLDFANLGKAMNGIIGLESSFALGVTYLVKQNHITLERLIELMSKNPAKIIGLDNKVGTIEEGKTADFAIFNIDEKFIYDKNNSRSKSRNTPFHGFELYGKILYTVVGGRVI